MASTGKTPSKPYGNVDYADPGYQDDKKARYPINSPEHAKAAWDYINKSSDADRYSDSELSRIKGRIKAAMKRFGIS